jgi:allantoate deiminase
MNSYDDSARLVIQRCDLLGGYSEKSEQLTRRYGTEPMRQANAAVAGWMRAAGMETRQDNIGNLIGRFEASAPDTKTFLLGSHLDTVRDAGKYDGPLGVLIALACVERLHARGERLPFALEVIAFADEEGLRFHSAYLGSAAFAGFFAPATLDQTDADGVTLAEAIRAFGGDPDRIANDARRRNDLLGYCEPHIEQGPVLEAQGTPVAIVSAIQGQTRVALTFTGEAGHTGTVPMAMRHDALTAAAEFTLAVESHAQAIIGLVATVGQLQVAPGASNVIPGQATLSLDVRHPDDETREEAVSHLREQATAIAERRGVRLEWRVASEHRAVTCSPRLATILARAVTDAGHPAVALASGAGHDAAIISTLTDVAMLFIRCKGGISHSPAESVTEADVAVAIEVMECFLALLGAEARDEGGAR